jgi:ABC-type Fe3+ transport system substrate-binding protein
MVFPNAAGMGTFIVPNAAVLIANGPNSANGRKFIEYLMTILLGAIFSECYLL